MKQLATAVFAVSLGFVWPVNDSSAEPSGHYRGYARYGWHRTHSLTYGNRVRQKKHIRTRRQQGKYRLNFHTRRRLNFHTRSRLNFRTSGNPIGNHSRFNGRWRKGSPRKYFLAQSRPRYFRSYIPAYFSSRPDVALDDSYLQKYLLLKEIVSGELGRKIGERDRIQMARTTQVALEKSPNGAVTEWDNPDSGVRGTVSTLSAFQVDRAKSCRKFQQTVTIGGITNIAYGVACRQKNGRWTIKE